MSASRKIAFVGLGIMGKPMAVNLVKAGHHVTGFDLSQASIDTVVAAGGHGAASIADAVKDAEVVITMVPADPHVEAVILGEGGVLENVGAGTLVIDMSSITPQTSIKVGKAAREKGVRTLDAPVSGGEAGAMEAVLSIMVGGEAAEQGEGGARPLFGEGGEAQGQDRVLGEEAERLLGSGEPVEEVAVAPLGGAGGQLAAEPGDMEFGDDGPGGHPVGGGCERGQGERGQFLGGAEGRCVQRGETGAQAVAGGGEQRGDEPGELVLLGDVQGGRAVERGGEPLGPRRGAQAGGERVGVLGEEGVHGVRVEGVGREAAGEPVGAVERRLGPPALQFPVGTVGTGGPVGALGALLVAGALPVEPFRHPAAGVQRDGSGGSPQEFGRVGHGAVPPLLLHGCTACSATCGTGSGPVVRPVRSACRTRSQ